MRYTGRRIQFRQLLELLTADVQAGFHAIAFIIGAELTFRVLPVGDVDKLLIQFLHSLHTGLIGFNRRAAGIRLLILFESFEYVTGRHAAGFAFIRISAVTVSTLLFCLC